MQRQISSLVTQCEADAFKELAVAVQMPQMLRGSGSLFSIQDGDLRAIEEIVGAALEHRPVHVHFKGSVAKGTDTLLSDTDVDIDTPGRTVSREDKEVVAEHLRKHPLFHESHVVLKRFAIGCIIGHTEVDLVFSQNLDRPGNLEERFKGNTAAQNAARMLKIALHHAVSPVLPAKLPSFVLEILVLNAQEANGASGLVKLSDGSLQLFCDTLQLILEAPGDTLKQVCSRCSGSSYCSLCKWFSLAADNGPEVGEMKRVSVREYVAELLHTLCASRVYSPDRRGFTNLCDMERWVRNFSGSKFFQTPMGRLPAWVMGHVDIDSQIINFIHLTFNPIPNTLQRVSLEALDVCLSQRKGEAEAFMSGPFSVYTRSGCKHATLLTVDSECNEHVGTAADTMLRAPEEQIEQVLSETKSMITDPSLLACWDRVHHKGSVLIVDSSGKGDFESIGEAMLDIQAPTSIIVLPGSYGLQYSIKGIPGHTLQIIGEGNVRLTMCPKVISDSLQLAIASGSGAHLSLTSLQLQCMSRDGSIRAHCAGARDGATINLVDCVLTSSAASCWADGAGSKLTLSRCKFLGPGSGALVINQGSSDAQWCTFLNIRTMAVEVRSGGRCRLTQCHIADCHRQGLALQGGARDAVLQDSTIENCGEYQGAAAMHVFSGKAIVQRCRITNNRGDGIVVEDDDGTAHVDITNSSVNLNSRGGISLYGGSACISDNQIQQNASNGLTIANNANKVGRPGASFRDVHLTGNVFSGNMDVRIPGLSISIVVRGDSLDNMLKRVKLCNNTHTLGRKCTAVFCPSMLEHVLVDGGNGLKIHDPCEMRDRHFVAEDSLVVGVRVELHGLNCSALNGSHGTLVRYDDTAGRWQVDLGELGSPDVKSVKPEHLRIALSAGAKVKMFGLKTASLNGELGTIVRFNKTSGRWLVKLQSAELKSLKRENICSVDFEKR